MPLRAAAILSLSLLLTVGALGATEIPLPEHPRPDFQRADWLNLNGVWRFATDAGDKGEKTGWEKGAADFPESVTVPFPWGSKLSGVSSQAEIAWYRRPITIPKEWKGKRVFLVVGASNWLTKGWIDGKPLGRHQGGYLPFEFELTDSAAFGREQQIVLRVDDVARDYKLDGKQGYGAARGIWQTVYLEARPALHIRSLHFTPDIDAGTVAVHADLSHPAPAGVALRLEFKGSREQGAPTQVAAGSTACDVTVRLDREHLWTLDDPYLYRVDAVLGGRDGEDRVSSYFGMRKIGVTSLPGTDIPYVALNGKPIYLQMTLDQSYHPDGFYTFPSDDFMRGEILRAKRLGLNADRIHIKVEVPRKLYWADRLGLLIMADVPNYWGDPTPEAKAESEAAMRGMISRDYNHPAIFSWVLFNETWGLFTQGKKEKTYLPQTQDWVASMYREAKGLDATRLVDDNSACNKDHVMTDMNTWHDYLPGYMWADHVEQIVADTHPGSRWNFIGGRTQGSQPLLNAECGDVWGYDGSTGDVDWSWDYHIMINAFRRQPKLAGWLYTELHDVINEWNGYYRFDRSPKVTGLDSFVPGMSVADLHSPLFLATGGDLCRNAHPGESVTVPLFASFLTDSSPGGSLVIRQDCYGWDSLGRREEYGASTRVIPFKPWETRELDPAIVTMPDHSALVVLALTLENRAGVVLHRNFTTFLVSDGPSPRDETVVLDGTRLRLIRISPGSFAASAWSEKQWNVLGGLKVDGAGSGYFEYRIPWPAGLDPAKVAGASFIAQASAKQLFGKDRAGASDLDGDYMRGKGSHDPSGNPNSYPMTGGPAFPSLVRVRVNGVSSGSFVLPDDPADHRGVLSWHAQPHDKTLKEAGSYGYLVKVPISSEGLAAAAAAGEIILRLEVDTSLPGGLALFSERFGRYPVDPTLAFEMRKP
jgi:hypothetical protein